MDRAITPSCQPVRPLIVDLARHFGGAEVRVLNTAVAFGPENCQVACLQGSPLAQKLQTVGFQPIQLGSSKLSPDLIFGLRRAVRYTQANLIDAHNIQSMFWGRLAFHGISNRPALLATIHSSIRVEQQNFLKGRLYETLQQWTLPGFDYVITVANYLCRELVDMALNEQKIRIIPNGVVLHNPNPADRLAVRREFGINANTPLIGTTARLEPAKGIDLLLESFEQVLRQNSGAKCLIAGDGRMAPELKDYAKSHGLEDAVIFAGFRSDIPRILSALDVFVLPSRTEGIPFSLLEACAAGLPVIATRVGGVPDVIQDGRTGLLVEPQNAQKFSQAILEMLGNPEAAAEIGKRAQEDIAARFSQNGMLASTQQVYQLAVEQKKAVQK